MCLEEKRGSEAQEKTSFNLTLGSTKPGGGSGPHPRAGLIPCPIPGAFLPSGNTNTDFVRGKKHAVWDEINISDYLLMKD